MAQLAEEFDAEPGEMAATSGEPEGDGTVLAENGGGGTDVATGDGT